jgi:hypothetical protein
MYMTVTGVIKINWQPVDLALPINISMTNRRLMASYGSV